MRKQYDQIHETAVKEIIDIFNTLKDLTDEGEASPIEIAEKIFGNKKSKTSYNSTSIAKASSDMTLTFPVLCSKSVSVETASMISKAIERKCVIMLQMLFSAYQISDKQTAMEYINQFHGNLDTRGMSIDDLFSVLGFMEESSLTISNSRLQAIREDLIYNTNHVLPKSISENSLNNFGVYDSRSTKPRIILEAAPEDDTHRVGLDRYRDKIIDNNETKNLKDLSDYRKNQILASEIKKANELMPTPLIVSYKYYDSKKDSKVVELGSIIIGVKAKLYYVDSADVVNRIVTKTHDKNWITQFIRGTTREISFWKDFMFAIDRIKMDALSFSNRSNSSKIWKALERRAANSKLRNTIGKNDSSVSAITNLVISQEEVELIKRTQGIDIERLNIAQNLLQGYNLLSLVIADDSLEVAKFLFDENDPKWENISYTHLEREASDNAYKKVVNMMTKVAR